MDVSRNGGDVAFRTAFSDEYDLVQVMCGLSSIPEKNCPVDFRVAALQNKGCGDIWHMDQVLAFSTDECSPMVINGEDIGGNHGHPCALRVTIPGHGKTVRDVGTLWRDEGGMSFTLLRVENADKLLFLSKNVGPSKLDYAFADHITGALTCADDGGVLLPQTQQGGVRRYMPKVRPFEAKGVKVDFTRLHPTTAATMPDYVPLTPDLWTNPASPPERQIDFICRPDGTPAVGFASGFLPVDDGAPARRAANITDAGTLVRSCKTYPTFAGGLASVRHPEETHPTFPRLKGTAYKKYFLPQGEGTCCYTVPHAGDTYVYMDFFSDEPHQLTYTKAPGEAAVLLEADVSCRMDDTALTAQGTAGCAAFCVSDSAKKG